MATTKVDLAIDGIISIEEVKHMNTEELDEFSEVVNKYIDSLYMGAKQTEEERMQQFREDAQEDDPREETMNNEFYNGGFYEA